IYRAFTLQVVGDQRLQRLAARQFHSVIQIQPRRGQIQDRDGEPLAVNVPTHSLAADPSRIKDPKSTAKRLAKILKLPWKTIYQRLRRPDRRFVWIRRHVSERVVKHFSKHSKI